MLTESQERALVSGGDCQLHHHVDDRRPTNDTVQRLAAVENHRNVTGTQTLLKDDDYVLADTTGGSVTLTLPRASDGKRITVIKKVVANTLTVSAPSGYNVMGTGSTNLSAAWEVLRLKLFDTTWVNI